MSVYNGEAFIRETLDSVLAQSFSDWEMIIVNNISTDGTQGVLDIYDDPRIKVIYPDSHGIIGVGLRLALSHAQGEYVAVQDADDVSTPDRFMIQVEALDNDASLGLVSGWYDLIDEKSQKIGEARPPTNQQDIIDAFQQTNVIAHSTCMFKRKATDLSGGYPLKYSYGCDFAMILGLLKIGWNIKILPHVVLKLREHTGQASTVISLNVERSHDAVHLAREVVQLTNISPSARRVGRRNLTKCILRFAIALLSEKQWAKAWGQLIDGLLNQPIYAIIYLSYRTIKYLRLIK